MRAVHLPPAGLPRGHVSPRSRTVPPRTFGCKLGFMRRRPIRVAMLVGTLLAGCGSSGHERAIDAGPADAGAGGGDSDAGRPDGGPADAAAPDAARADGGPADAGAPPGCAAIPRGVAASSRVYDDRAAFAAALGECVEVVGFDDVDTTGADPVPIDADRYLASHGVVITGQDGQYVDESFSYPTEFVVVSAPNMLAPGPMADMSAPAGTGGHTTDVTFASGGAVAAFGAYFIDADYPDLGPTSLAVFDAADAEITVDGPIVTADGEAAFRGVITFDAAGNPVSAIHRIHLVTGQGWPGTFDNEGVVMDDFAFSAPVAE